MQHVCSGNYYKINNKAGRQNKKKTISELKVTKVAVCILTQWAPQSTYMNLLKANMKNHSCLFFFSVNGFQWKVFCNLYEGWWVYYSKLSTIGSEVSKENFIWSYYSMGERPEPSLIQNVLKRRTDYSLGAGVINWKSSRGCSRSGGIGEAKHTEFANTFLWLGHLRPSKLSPSPQRGGREAWHPPAWFHFQSCPGPYERPS